MKHNIYIILDCIFIHIEAQYTARISEIYIQLFSILQILLMAASALQELLYSSRPPSTTFSSEYYKTTSTTKVSSPHQTYYSTTIAQTDPGLYTREDDEQVVAAYDRWLASINKGYFIPSPPDTPKDQYQGDDMRQYSDFYSTPSLQRPPSPSSTDFDIFLNKSNTMGNGNGILSSEELDSIFESFDVAMMDVPEHDPNVFGEDEITAFSLDGDAAELVETFGRIAMI